MVPGTCPISRSRQPKLAARVRLGGFIGDARLAWPRASTTSVEAFYRVHNALARWETGQGARSERRRRALRPAVSSFRRVLLSLIEEAHLPPLDGAAASVRHLDLDLVTSTRRTRAEIFAMVHAT
jgi:hypothetical protein